MIGTILQNITAIIAILAVIGGIIIKFTAMDTKITVLAVRLDAAEKDVIDLRAEILHSLERMENKLDQVIRDQHE